MEEEAGPLATKPTADFAWKDTLEEMNRKLPRLLVCVVFAYLVILIYPDFEGKDRLSLILLALVSIIFLIGFLKVGQVYRARRGMLERKIEEQDGQELVSTLQTALEEHEIPFSKLSETGALPTGFPRYAEIFQLYLGSLQIRLPMFASKSYMLLLGPVNPETEERVEKLKEIIDQALAGNR